MKVCISQLEVSKPNSELAPVKKKCGGQKKLAYVTEKDEGIVTSDMAGLRAQRFCEGYAFLHLSITFSSMSALLSLGSTYLRERWSYQIGQSFPVSGQLFPRSIATAMSVAWLRSCAHR